MNIAVIFAGGIGSRMENTELPKQFIEIDDVPILIHTLRNFQNNDNIDAIVLVMLESWIETTQEMVSKYKISKVEHIVPGGESGQMSIFNGLKKAYEEYDNESIVLIHDGVRPFINSSLINENINSVREFGSAVSSVGSIETFLVTNSEGTVLEIPDRSNSMIAKAPQSFVLRDIYNVHLQAQKDGVFSSIDSCTLMFQYGKPVNIVMTDQSNIKITTPKDIEIARSIYEREEQN